MFHNRTVSSHTAWHAMYSHAVECLCSLACRVRVVGRLGPAPRIGRGARGWGRCAAGAGRRAGGRFGFGVLHESFGHMRYKRLTSARSAVGAVRQCSRDPCAARHCSDDRRPHSVDTTECGRRSNRRCRVEHGSQEHAAGQPDSLEWQTPMCLR